MKLVMLNIIFHPIEKGIAQANETKTLVNPMSICHEK